MPNLNQVSLAILCGGRSQRFGTDKGLYAATDHEPLVVRAINSLGVNFSEINVIVRDDDQKQIYRRTLSEHVCFNGKEGVQVLADEDEQDQPPRAAISGIVTALKVSRAPYALTVAVDQFRIRAQDLDILCTSLETFSRLRSKPAVAYTNKLQGDVLPLPSLWPKDSLSRIEQCMERNILSIKAIMNHIPVIQFDPGRNYPFLIANANFQTDLNITSSATKRKEKPWPISLI